MNMNDELTTETHADYPTCKSEETSKRNSDIRWNVVAIVLVAFIILVIINLFISNMLSAVIFCVGIAVMAIFWFIGGGAWDYRAVRFDAGMRATSAKTADMYRDGIKKSTETNWPFIGLGVVIGTLMMISGLIGYIT
jgi:hypothetical protein